MTKEQAAETYTEKEAGNYKVMTSITTTVFKIREYIKKAFKSGWEAHEAKSPSDAVAFAEWIDKQSYFRVADGSWVHQKERHMRGVAINTTELYKLFNPSGVTPQQPTEHMVKALEQVRDFSTAKLGCKYLSCIIADCISALEEYYKNDITGLDESPRQVFTRDQVEMAFYAAYNSINRILPNPISIETIKQLHKDYMELNYPKH